MKGVGGSVLQVQGQVFGKFLWKQPTLSFRTCPEKSRPRALTNKICEAYLVAMQSNWVLWSCLYGQLQHMSWELIIYFILKISCQKSKIRWILHMMILSTFFLHKNKKISLKKIKCQKIFSISIILF